MWGSQDHRTSGNSPTFERSVTQAECQSALQRPAVALYHSRPLHITIVYAFCLNARYLSHTYELSETLLDVTLGISRGGLGVIGTRPAPLDSTKAEYTLPFIPSKRPWGHSKQDVVEEVRKAGGQHQTLLGLPSYRSELEADGAIWGEAVNRYQGPQSPTWKAEG